MKWLLFGVSVVAVVLVMFFLVGLFRIDLPAKAEAAGSTVREATGV